jgi:hypothetical protein
MDTPGRLADTPYACTSVLAALRPTRRSVHAPAVTATVRLLLPSIFMNPLIYLSGRR